MTSNGEKILNYFKQGTFTFKKVTDEEFDELIQRAIAPLQKVALQKTLLHESECIRDSEMLFGPARAKNSLLEHHFKKGKDGLVRYTPIVVTIMNFTEHELVIYKCVFDPITETALNQSTWTYFYKEIVSIETKEPSRTGEFLTSTQKVLAKVPLIELLVKGKQKHFNVSKEFILTTRGSSFYKARLSDYEILDEVGGEFKISEAENTIRAIRTALRDKQR
ncbi:hypothetical protein [uncultured Dokdonia sp.]|uniref:hypothetical protein n=1 Tax=uncultured Dokdonia sp. TaxID=575653 RepID=UPI002617F74B|nr:hypothetical protein [uncultured Dokdonia sp.]